MLYITKISQTKLKNLFPLILNSILFNLQFKGKPIQYVFNSLKLHIDKYTETGGGLKYSKKGGYVGIVRKD